LLDNWQSRYFVDTYALLQNYPHYPESENSFPIVLLNSNRTEN